MTVELGLLTRTKLFQQHVLAKRDAVNGTWETYDEGDTIDAQVQAWVAGTGNVIVTVSAPGYAMGWLDEELTTRSILVGVVVIYRPALEGTHAKRGTCTGTSHAANTGVASNQCAGDGVKF